MKVENPMGLLPVIPVEMPVGLTHLDSDFCWCDPLVELDENARQIIVHRHVIWN